MNAEQAKNDKCSICGADSTQVSTAAPWRLAWDGTIERWFCYDHRGHIVGYHPRPKVTWLPFLIALFLGLFVLLVFHFASTRIAR